MPLGQLGKCNTNLGEREANALGRSNHCDAAKHVATVAALVAAVPIACEQAIALIEAHRRRREPATFGNLSDA